MFLHNQLLSAGNQGGTAGGVFTFVDAQYPTFATVVNDASSHSLYMNSATVSDFAWWSAIAQGSSFWSAGFTIEVWCWVATNTELGLSAGGAGPHQNIVRLGDAVNNYGQAIGICNAAGGLLTMSAWNTDDQRIVDNLAISYSTWTHLCIERGAVENISGTDKQRFSYYINGAQRYSDYGTATTYQSVPSAPGDFESGHRWSDTGITLGKGAPGPSTETAGFRGYINSARITRGVRYGAAFTPSTSLTKDANTWFLVQLNNNYATE